MMTNTEVTERTTIKKEEQHLIKGDFSPEDATEIINHMINNKIRFHEVRSFSSEIRLGKTDPSSEKRAVELRESSEVLNNLIKQAQEEGKNVRIASTIAIEII